MKLVLDTNVVVSSVLSGQGAEARVFDLALNRRVSMFVSNPILTEYKEVLSRQKFGLTASQVEATMKLIKTNSTLTHPKRRVDISPDEPDNRFLECAETAKADYLVTGNKRHFPKRWKTTQVVNARELLEVIALGLQR